MDRPTPRAPGTRGLGAGRRSRAAGRPRSRPPPRSRATRPPRTGARAVPPSR